MKLANWKDLDRKELNEVKSVFTASKDQAMHDVAVDYIDEFGSEFRDNDFIMSLVDAHLNQFKISDKQAFWLSVAYLTYKDQ